ncbi:flagellin [Bacillus carboniphilus]|uniref:Flagellin n=1 Tax=Bacillus carboniphilus TaxID=86663 RepID=A0ABN0VW17_9BACI
MRINHNIAALNTYRQLGAANAGQSKSMEKLSSGLRINRAGDDAAGLAISEKMRGQIRGLEMASKNSQDGISLIQTAEGALNETHSILQRMRELAVQSANDTNTNKDREQLQAEVDELAKEITRISDTTEFNTQSLLDGTFSGTFQIGANANQNIDLSINGMDSADLAVAASTKTVTTFDSNIDFSKSTTATVSFEVVTNSATVTAGNTLSATVAVDSANNIVITLGKTTAGNVTLAATAAVELINNSTAAAALVTAQVNTAGDGTISAAVTAANITGVTAYDLTKGIDIETQSAADSAITVIDNAINTVSNERSKLGAYQNRLEHTINNLGTSAENLTAAESRIRDVDMAKEMMAQTKNSILAQAAQAMLAQANQQPQGVLQLLR